MAFSKFARSRWAIKLSPALLAGMCFYLPQAFGQTAGDPQASQTTVPGQAALPSQFSLDLASTAQNLSSPNSSAVSIQVGGQVGASGTVTNGNPVTINPASPVTPAQFAAIAQVMSGSQSLLLAPQGNAAGGFVTLVGNSGTSSLANLTNLVVPQNTALNSVNFGVNNPLNISGTATVSGAVYAFNTQSAIASAINLSNLVVNAGGLVSGSVPANLASMTGLSNSAALVISATNQINNAGTISSPGALSLLAGQGIINQPGANIIAQQTAAINAASIINHGQITSILDSINITAGVTRDLLVNNSGGRLVATAGAINVRDMLYNGSNNMTILGGELLSRELNLSDGTGKIALNVIKVSGVINVNGGSADLITTGSGMQIASLNLTGDPLIASAGTLDLSLLGPLVFPGQDLALVSSQDVLANGAATIDLSNTNPLINGGNGGNLLVIAGFDFVPTGPTSIQLTGPSATQGLINLFGTPIDTRTTVAGAQAGNVTLISSNTAGFGAGSDSITATSPAGNGGNVLVIGNSATLVNVDTSGLNAGTITAFGAFAEIVGVVDINDGTLLPGGSFTPSLLSTGTNVVGENLVALGTPGTGAITLGAIGNGGSNASVFSVISSSGAINVGNAVGSGLGVTRRTNFGGRDTRVTGQSITFTGNRVSSRENLSNAASVLVATAGDIVMNAINTVGAAFINTSSFFPGYGINATANGGNIILNADDGIFLTSPNSSFTANASVGPGATGGGIQFNTGAPTPPQISAGLNFTPTLVTNVPGVNGPNGSVNVSSNGTGTATVNPTQITVNGGSVFISANGTSPGSGDITLDVNTAFFANSTAAAPPVPPVVPGAPVPGPILAAPPVVVAADAPKISALPTDPMSNGLTPVDLVRISFGFAAPAQPLVCTELRMSDRSNMAVELPDEEDIVTESSRMAYFGDNHCFFESGTRFSPTRNGINLVQGRVFLLSGNSGLVVESSGERIEAAANSVLIVETRAKNKISISQLKGKSSVYTPVAYVEPMELNAGHGARIEPSEAASTPDESPNPILSAAKTTGEKIIAGENGSLRVSSIEFDSASALAKEPLMEIPETCLSPETKRLMEKLQREMSSNKGPTASTTNSAPSMPWDSFNACKPVALQQPTQIKPLRLAELRSEGAVARCSKDKSVSLIAKGFQCGSGETVINTWKKTLVRIDERNNLHLSAGTVVHVDTSEPETFKIRNLCDNAQGAIKLETKGKIISLEIGQELIYSRTQDCYRIVRNDGVSRRRIRQIDLNSGKMLLSEFSPLGLFAESPVLKVLLSSSGKNDAQLVAKILKSQVALAQSTFSHGPFGK